MSRRKSKKSKPDRAGLWMDRRRTAMAAGWLAGLSALGAAWVLGVPRLEAYASLAEAGGAPKVRFARPPGWLDADLHGKLVAAARQHLGADPFAQEQLVATRAALLSTGWFEAVPQVRRQQRHLVEIEARFAEPRALVRDANGDHLIDAHGMLLPTPHPAAQHARLATILGETAARPRRLGQRWNGAAVSAALRLLHRVQGRPWADQITAIDVSVQTGQPQIQLITDRGCRIIWGRPPGDETASEVQAERKLRYLDYHHREYGHIDRGFPRTLDIRGDVVIGR